MNDEVKPLIQSFLAAALEVLRSQRSELVIPTTTYVRGVEYKSPNHRKIDIAHEPDLTQLDELFHTLCTVPEFTRALNAVEGHPNSRVIFADVGGNDVHPNNRYWWLLGWYLIPFVNDYIRPGFDLTLDQARFESAYARLDEALEATEIRHSLVIPLTNFVCKPPIAILDHISVRDMRSDEVKTLERFASRGSLDKGLVLDLSTCVSADFVMPKTGDGGNSPSAKHTDWILTALRLLKSGDVGSPCRLSHVASPRYGVNGSSLSHVRTIPNGGDPYEFSSRDIEGFVEILEALTDIKVDHPQLGIPLRRFEESYYRSSPADRLIDNWVALESLFANPGETQELTYKFAVRIARYIGRTGTERKKAYVDVKHSYSVRSKVIHGERSNKGLSRAIVNAERVLRDSLRRAVLSGAPPILDDLDNQAAGGEDDATVEDN